MSAERDIRREIIDKYRARAKNYDFTTNLYYLIGYPEWAHRRQAVYALALGPGDTVVEVGCGTGLNFPLLQQAVGPTGKIVGVDLTDAMLDQARQRVRDRGWNNVELVHSDALRYDFAPGADGIISTYALSLIPECGEVIYRGARALRSGGRWVVLDLKLPDRWPEWLSSLLLPLVRPFAVTDEWLARRPWETIKQVVDDSLTHCLLTEMYLGLAYILSGVRKDEE